MSEKPKKRETERITKEYLLVIEYQNNQTNEITDINKLITNLKILSEFYAIILHDKDTKIDNDTNEIIDIRKHYHVVIKLKKRTRKSTLLKHLSNYNQILAEMIQIEYMENIQLSIRYLLHKDNPEKHQYAPFEINTNSSDFVQSIIDTELHAHEITAKQLIHYIYTMKYGVTRILEIIGIKNFNKYAKTIQMLMNDYYENSQKYEYDKRKEIEK